MAPNEGEEILDALLFLGYTVEIADDGAITATQGQQILHGKASVGAIEWTDRSALFRVRERAYIARLRARVNTGGKRFPADVGRGAGQE